MWSREGETAYWVARLAEGHSGGESLLILAMTGLDDITVIHEFGANASNPSPNVVGPDINGKVYTRRGGMILYGNAPFAARRIDR